MSEPNQASEGGKVSPLATATPEGDAPETGAAGLATAHDAAQPILVNGAASASENAVLQNDLSGSAIGGDAALPGSGADPVPPTAPTGPPNDALADDEAERRIHRISRRSFLWGAAAVTAGFTGWRLLISGHPDSGIPWPFRRGLEINEGVARDYFKDARLAPTFARSLAKEPRQNGDDGLSDDFDPADWHLKVTGLDESAQPDSSEALALTLAAIKKLPRTEMVTELKCIEGWSVIVQWAGARLSDFVAKYPPAKDDAGHLPQYVGMETPDGGYYVGLDMASALHPQTLLCYEMNGAPLALEHGAPLRLVIPVKYGIKHIKRIGLIRFTNERPKDFWAEQGYDWYAGH